MDDIKLRLLVFGVFASASVIISFGHFVNKSYSFTEVVAVTNSTQSECYIVSPGPRKNTNFTTETLPCKKAQKLVEQHPAYQKGTVQGKTWVNFEYISPVDNVQRTASLEYDLHDPAIQNISYGAKINILAHNDKVDVVRSLNDPRLR